MSTYDRGPNDQYDARDPYAPRQEETNVLGIVGFVLAFCLSPVGLLISLIALTKRPRGFAVAGVVVGLLGSVIWGLIIAGVVAAAPLFRQAAELTTDYKAIDTAIAQYEQQNNAPPPDLAALGLGQDVLTDPWGTPYRYTLTDTGWTLASPGADGQWDTDDDVVFTAGMTDDEVGQVIGEMFEELGRQWGQGGAAPAPATTPGADEAPPVEEAPAEEAPMEEPVDGTP